MEQSSVRAQEMESVSPGSNPSSTPYSCVIVGVLFNLTKPQFLIYNVMIILIVTS